MPRWLIAFYFTLVQAILTVGLVHGQQPRCSFRHYSTADGLSDNRVTCITKDHEGFLWMGTWAGINRFDGQNFVTYKSHPGDSSELKNNRIDNIVEGENGFLWLQAYDKKIYRFNKKTEQFLSISKLLEARSKKPIDVDKIEVLHHNQVAIITKQQGVFVVSTTHSDKPIVKWFSSHAEANHKLPFNDVSVFYQDSLQRIWIGSSNVLSCFKPNSKGDFEKVIIPDDLMKEHVTAVAENSSAICFGTGSGKVFRLTKNKNELISIDLMAGRINALKFSNRNTNLFCSTSKGNLVTLNTNALQPVSNATFGNKELLSIYEDRRGMLWIEPHDIGVIMFDPQEKKFKHFTQKNFSNHNLEAKEYGVFEDSNGTVFVNMRGCGFGYFDLATQRVEYFYNEPGTNDYRFSNMTSAEFYDSAGILWLNTGEGGLEKITLPQNEFIYTRLVNNSYLRAENDVRGIYSDSRGQLWIANKAGKVFIWKDGKVVKTILLDNPIHSNGVYAIIEDKKKNIWLGTKGNGLFKAEPTGDKEGNYRITHFVHNVKDTYSISSDLVYSLLEDQEGRIWIGTYGGGVNLINQRDGTTRFYHHKNRFLKYPSDVCDRVRSLALDASGKIWIGTTEGLLLFDPSKTDFYDSKFTRYVKVPLNVESLGDNDVQYIHRDKNNTMWVLTSSGGLNKAIGDKPMESLKFLNYTKKDGLPSDYLLSCVEDAKGYLWIATQNGLARFDLTKDSFQNYNVSDGLPMGGFSEASCAITANGELFFGMLNGYLHFNPTEIVQPKIIGNIVFTNLQVNNEDVVPSAGKSLLTHTINHTKEITLTYDQVVSIDYRMLDYRSHEKITYAYRLVGFNSTWRNNKNETRASFTGLPPGSYTFEVKSTNADLYSNVPSRALNIIILPPPWKTWWAFVVYFILGIGVLWIIRKYTLVVLRLRQGIIIERKLTDLKLNFFTNVSHELRTPLTLILNPLEEISRTEKLTEQGNKYLTVVRKNAQRMSRFINQLLDLRKAESGKTMLKVSEVELVSFVRRTLGYFADLADQKKLSITIESSAAEVFAWIDIEKIDIVIYNVLANALKFTPEGKKITVTILANSNDTIAISVIDEGRGVPNSQLDEIFGLYFGGEPGEGNNFKGTGIGLALSKELVKMHHGKISARNNTPHGLIVSVELKAGKDHFEKDNVVFVDTHNEVQLELDRIIVSDEAIEFEPIVSPGNDQLPQLLLVEDNRDLRSFLHAQLSHIYRVEIAENGQEGLQKAKGLLPDVVLTDVMMPVMDGITMLSKLKNDPETSHIPVVLLSAKFSVESQIEALKYGADHYLAKPFRNDFLVASLNNLIAQRKRFFESILQNKKTTIEVNPTELVITSHDELFLKKVITVVEERMKESQFNIDAVADLMNMSRSPFYKKLKSLTGLSPVEFVKEIRLKRSLQYLDAGEQNISTIAFEVGFKSAKYFSTCFRQRFNETPSEYFKSKVRIKS